MLHCILGIDPVGCSCDVFRFPLSLLSLSLYPFGVAFPLIPINEDGIPIISLGIDKICAFVSENSIHLFHNGVTENCHISGTFLKQCLQAGKYGICSQLQFVVFADAGIPAGTHALCENFVADILCNILKIQVFNIKSEQNRI